MYGFKWCGRYSSLFQKTLCADTIDFSLCKVPVAEDEVSLCYNEILNPVYQGRPEPAWVAEKEAIANGEPASNTGVWDMKCTQEIKLKYDELQPYREITHKVKRGKFCLITINNMSGRNHSIQVIEETNNEKMVLYKLDNTDEMQWKTFKLLEAQLNAEFPGVDQHELHETQKNFDIISGMGKGVYIINLDTNNDISFQTKITMSGGAKIFAQIIGLLGLLIMY